MEKKYSYDRFGTKGARVGQAAIDMMSQAPINMTVEELMEGVGKKFTQELETCIEENSKKYDGVFHIVVLGKKDLTQFGITNVDRNWFIARKTAPILRQISHEYPHFVKTLYKVDSKKGDIQLKWSVPSVQDCVTICKKPNMYDPDLAKWAHTCIKNTPLAAHVT